VLFRSLTKVLKDVTFPAVVKRGSIKFQDKRFKNVFYTVGAGADTCHLTPTWQLVRKDGSTTQLAFDYTSSSNSKGFHPGIKQYNEAFKLIKGWYDKAEIRMKIRTIKGLI